MEDDEILDLFFERNERAISEAAAKYGRYCHSIAFNILHNDEDCEECVNDAYLRAWNSIPPERPQKLGAYLGKITRNLSLNKWEKISAQKRSGVNIVLDELAECIPDSSNSDFAESIAVREIIDKFLDKLPENKRNIFVKRYWYMNSPKEIAEEYGISESRVNVTLFRLRKQLRDLFEKEGIFL